MIYICEIAKDKKFTKVKLLYESDVQFGVVDFCKVVPCEGKIYFLSYYGFGVIDVDFGKYLATLRF